MAPGKRSLACLGACCSGQQRSLHTRAAASTAAAFPASALQVCRPKSLAAAQTQAVNQAGIRNRGMRCVPDASADADPASGYTIIMCGPWAFAS